MPHTRQNQEEAGPSRTWNPHLFTVYPQPCSSPSPPVSAPGVWKHAAAAMQQHRIVNLSDLLFCLATEWEAAL